MNKLFERASSMRKQSVSLAGQHFEIKLIKDSLIQSARNVDKLNSKSSSARISQILLNSVDRLYKAELDSFKRNEKQVEEEFAIKRLM